MWLELVHAVDRRVDVFRCQIVLVKDFLEESLFVEIDEACLVAFEILWLPKEFLYIQVGLIWRLTSIIAVCAFVSLYLHTRVELSLPHVLTCIHTS